MRSKQPITGTRGQSLVIARASLLDRLLHHCHVVGTCGTQSCS